MDEQMQEVKVKKSWEEYISLGMEARANKDDSQWMLGDLSLEIAKDYGNDAIGKYSYAIGVERKTLMNYRTVANNFKQDIRERYRKLSFSHFASLTSVEKPEAWLNEADNKEWSVETLRKSVRKAYEGLKAPDLTDKPPEVIKCLKCGLWKFKDLSTFEICRGHYTMKVGGEIIYE